MGQNLVKATIKILVVDDSYLFREIVARGVTIDPQLEVIGKASSIGEVRGILALSQPDILLCSSNFPNIYLFNIPVLFISNSHQFVPSAMNDMVLGVITKPDVQSAAEVEQFIVEIISRVKAVNMDVHTPWGSTQRNAKIKLIAIGASTGGTEALFRVLKELPTQLPGIVIVQHIPPVFSKMFAERLNQQTQISAKEAQTGDLIEPGNAYIAPGDQHMKIIKVGDRFRLECFQGDRVNGHCPSVDVLFHSVAKLAGSEALGIILTGMGRDGAKGLLAMRQSGARTIGQDEKSSVVYGMPKVAYEIGAVEIQLPLDKISEKIISLLGLV